MMRRFSSVSLAGRVASVAGDSQRIHIAGLKTIQLGSIVQINQHKAMVVQLGQKSVTALTMEKQSKSFEYGDQVFSLGDQAHIRVSKSMLGRNKISSPLGLVDNNARSVEIPVFPQLNRNALASRSSVSKQINTGIVGVDLFYPIGHGMRIAIIGDKKGKALNASNLAVEMAVNLSFTEPDTICVYAMIGKSESEIQRMMAKLEEERNPANQNIVVIASSNTDPLALQYMAPFSACAVGNYFRDLECRRVVVVLDNMHSHAQISAAAASDSIREKFAMINNAQAKIFEQFYQSEESAGGGSSSCICVDFRESMSSNHVGDGTDLVLHKASTENLLSLVDDAIFIAKEKTFGKKSRKSFPVLGKYQTLESKNVNIDLAKVLSRPGTRFHTPLKQWILKFVKEILMPRRVNNYVTKDVINVIGAVEYDQAVDNKEFMDSVFHLLTSTYCQQDSQLFISIYCGIKALDHYDESPDLLKKFRSVDDLSGKILEFIESKDALSPIIDHLESTGSIPSSEQLQSLDSICAELSAHLLK